MKTFYCSNCNKKYAVQDDLDDDKMVCPNCNTFIYEQSDDEFEKTNLSNYDIQIEQLRCLRIIKNIAVFFAVLTAIGILRSLLDVLHSIINW